MLMVKQGAKVIGLIGCLFFMLSSCESDDSDNMERQQTVTLDIGFSDGSSLETQGSDAIYRITDNYLTSNIPNNLTIYLTSNEGYRVTVIIFIDGESLPPLGTYNIPDSSNNTEFKTLDAFFVFGNILQVTHTGQGSAVGQISLLAAEDNFIEGTLVCTLLPLDNSITDTITVNGSFLAEYSP